MTIWQFHSQGVGPDDVGLEDYPGCLCPLGFCVWAEEVHEDRMQVVSADLCVVLEQFNAVDAHEAKQSVVAALELVLSIPGLTGGEFAAQYLLQESAFTAGWLEDASIDAFGLVLDQVEHVVDHPRWCEYLAVVSNALLGFHEVVVFAHSCCSWLGTPQALGWLTAWVLLASLRTIVRKDCLSNYHHGCLMALRKRREGLTGATSHDHGSTVVFGEPLHDCGMCAYLVISRNFALVGLGCLHRAQ